MINFLLNTKVPGKIGFFEFDATLHEGHEYTNIVTEFPVEKGFSISDHVQRMPEKLTIQGFTTNSPIPHSRGSVAVLVDKSNRVNTALEALLQIGGFDSAGKATTDISAAPRVPIIVTVVTGLRVYTNMMITNISIPRDKDTGETLTYTVELRRLIVAFSEIVIIQNVSELNGRAAHAIKMAVKTVNKSAQTVTQVAVDKGTILSQLIAKFKGI